MKQTSDIEQFKKALGKTGEKLSLEQLEALFACVSNLIDTQLDAQEKTIFGKTIDQIVNET